MEKIMTIGELKKICEFMEKEFGPNTEVHFSHKVWARIQKKEDVDESSVDGPIVGHWICGHPKTNVTILLLTNDSPDSLDDKKE